MNYEIAAKKLAAQLGATVTKEFYREDREHDIAIAAPDGKQWVSMQCIHLTARYWSYAPETKLEAWKDLYERLQEGLEEYDESVNG